MNADYDYLMKIIVVGESGCGKSSLLNRYVDKVFYQSFVSTVGVDFKFKYLTLNSGKTAKLQLWDTAGQERFRTIVANYWRSADGVVFVLDLTDLASFEAVRHWALEADSHLKPGTQRILIGNKSDLLAKRQVTRTMGEALAASMGIKYIETSAKTTENVDEAFSLTAEIVANNYQNQHGVKNDKPKPAFPEDDRKDSASCCAVM